LKSKILAAKRDYTKREDSERKAQTEKLDRRVADNILHIVAEQTESLDASAQRLDDIAVPLTGADVAVRLGFVKPLSLLRAAEQSTEAAGVDVTSAKEILKEHQSSVANVTRSGSIQDAKQGLNKLQTKVDAIEKRVKVSFGSVKTACDSIAEARSSQVAGAIREMVQTQSLNLEAIFAEQAAGQERIMEDVFCKYVSTLPGLDFPEEHANLLFRHVAADGVTCRAFLRMVQQYFVCTKEIAVTTNFEISISKTVRRMELGQIIEVLEGPQCDEKLGVTRIKGRVLSDGVVGWISVKGNQGTPFLKPCDKPFYKCTCEASLDSDVSTGSGEIRAIEVDEVIEVLQGPQREKPDSAQRARGKAVKDGATGWFTVKDQSGTEIARVGSYYKVAATVAMTDALEIKTCKVVRKLDVDEIITLLEEPSDEGGTSRAKARALKDDTEGWVTLKGNAGTVYADVNRKYYAVLQDTPLQKTFASEGSEEVRILEQDEAIDVLEGPRDEHTSEIVRLKGRAAKDGAEGWVTLRDSHFVEWTDSSD